MAGGYATRLWPMARDVAKPLLPIGDRTVVDHIMERIGSLKAVKEVVVLTNSKFEGQFRGWLGRRALGGVKDKGRVQRQRG